MTGPVPEGAPTVPADHETELPYIQQEAPAWLRDNNVSDQKVMFWMATVLAVIGCAFQAWWSLALSACIYLGIFPRKFAAGFFARGRVKEGLLVANATPRA